MDTTHEVGQFIVDELALEGPIAPDEDLLERGVLDSAGIAQLLQFLEERFSITVADDELVAENFQSVAAISELITDKLAARV